MVLRIVVLGGLVALVSCAAPVSQMGGVTRDQLQSEQLKQQSLVLESTSRLQARVDNVAFALESAALPLCGNQVSYRAGMRVQNLASFDKAWWDAARALGFGDSLQVVSVTAGSPADRAGLKPRDVVLAINGTSVQTGKNATQRFAKDLSEASPQREGGTFELTVRRASDSTRATLTIGVEPVCSYGTLAIKEDVLNAWADGQSVYVTSSMLRFAGTDDELAVVLGHEIAHNAMRHMDAKKRNAGIGALFGAALDVLAASQGVNTQGAYSNLGAQAGSQVFSQDFEREADYVGMYILARAGRPYQSAADFWRRMGTEMPGSIKFASTHPTTAERFVRLEQTAAEIDKKREAGQLILPSKKN